MTARLWRLANGAAVAIGLLGGWVLAARLLPTGLPPGILVEGTISGGLLALSACGVVLVYRIDRVVNFAQAGIGSIAAVAAVALSVHFGWPWGLALPTGLLAGAALGAGASLGIIDRMRNAPRLAATVATIGIGETLAGGTTLLAGATPTRDHTRPFTLPLHLNLSLRPLLFHADDAFALVVVAAVGAGLAWLLLRTPWGLAFRAAGDDAERARLAGIPTPVLSLGVWAIAGGLAALAIMLRAPLSGPPVTAQIATDSTSVLLRVLTAAAVGGMTDLRKTAIAAIAIGVLDDVATWAYARTTYVDVLLVVVLLVVLLGQRDRFTRAAEAASSRLAVRTARPLSAAAARVPLIKWGRLGLAAALVGAAVMFPIIARPDQDHAGSVICVYGIVAVSLLVLTGWAGSVSLGQFALVGVGAAVSSVLVGEHGWDATLAIGAGMAVTTVVAVVLGLPTLRARGPIAAVTTLAFAVAASSYLLVHRFVPWLIDDDPVARPVLWRRIRLQGEAATYELCLAGLVLAMVVARNLRRSRAGRDLLAVRDNEAAAAASGIGVARTKLVAFAVSGALAGLAGGLYMIVQQGMLTDSYTPEASLRLFAMVIVGGLSSISGVVLGAVVIRGTEVLFPAGWALLASGVGITALVAIFPEGLGGLVVRARDLLVRQVMARSA